MFEIGDFVDSIIRENEQFAAIDDVDILRVMKGNLTDKIEAQIFAMIVEELPPIKQKEFDKLIDADNEDKLFAFITANIPNLDIKVGQLLIDIKKSYVGL